MDKQEFVEELKDRLLALPYAHYTAGDTDIACRCPFCGDSVKNRESTHFYVKVSSLDKDEVPIYHCYRCEVGGVFKYDTMKMLEIYDTTLGVNLGRYNKNAMKGAKFKKYEDRDRKTLILPNYNRSEFSNLEEVKVRYIEKRLGITLSSEDLQKYKVVVDLNNVLAYNNIRKKTYKDYTMDILSNYFIGFSNATNDFIHLRNVLPKMHKLDRRYFIYNIHSTEETTNKFYIIPNKIDIFKTVDVILTEGIFDILGVYNHVYDCDDDNKLYCAVCGSGFLTAIRYLVKKGIVNFNLKIYSDNEKNRGPNFYKKLKRDIRAFYDGKIELYYNDLSKDCGVTKDMISLRQVTI